METLRLSLYDLSWKVNIKPYFTQHLLEEFRGIAKALDITQDEAIEVHIMTEGFKGIGFSDSFLISHNL